MLENTLRWCAFSLIGFATILPLFVFAESNPKVTATTKPIFEDSLNDGRRIIVNESQRAMTQAEQKTGREAAELLRQTNPEFQVILPTAKLRYDFTLVDKDGLEKILSSHEEFLYGAKNPLSEFDPMAVSIQEKMFIVIYLEASRVYGQVVDLTNGAELSERGDLGRSISKVLIRGSLSTGTLEVVTHCPHSIRTFRVTKTEDRIAWISEDATTQPTSQPIQNP